MSLLKVLCFVIGQLPITLKITMFYIHIHNDPIISSVPLKYLTNGELVTSNSPVDG